MRILKQQQQQQQHLFKHDKKFSKSWCGRVKKSHQVQDITLIEHQILITNLQGNIYQLKGRINNQILGVKGLRK